MLVVYIKSNKWFCKDFLFFLNEDLILSVIN